MSHTIATLPFPLAEHRGTWQVSDNAVQGRADAGTDIFVQPVPGKQPKLDGAMLVGEAPEGDFQFHARVRVGFGSSFDAGVLMLWLTEQYWAKLCFEVAPNGKPMVVSVVNRQVSDDANAFVVDSEAVWLRISRVDGVLHFHASVDGNLWELVRVFGLSVENPAEPSAAQAPAARLGFAVQSPLGDGCEATFDDIAFTSSTLADPRDGS